MHYRIIALCIVLASHNCFGQGYYSVRTESLDDGDVATAFAIGDVIFVIRQSAISARAVGVRDLSKVLPITEAVKNGLPDNPTAKLIDELLGGPHQPHLAIASAMDRGDEGFVWKMDWNLFPSVGGFSGIPFEYHAYVRQDGVAVRPELSVCDRFAANLFEPEYNLFSTLSFADLIPATSDDVDQDQIRRCAEQALKDAIEEYHLKLSFRLVNVVRHSYRGSLCRDLQSPVDVVAWAVNFVPDNVPKAKEKEVDPFTVWVTSDCITSKFSIGEWRAKQQRAKD